MATKLTFLASVIMATVFVHVHCQSNDEFAQSARNILYSTVVDKNLLEELLPNPIGIEPSNSEDYNKFMSILEDLVKLDSINKTLHELVESEIPESYKDHLKGFKIIIHEVLIDACNWFKASFQGNHTTCSFSYLGTKLDLFKQLNATETDLKQLLNTTSNCS